MGLRSSHQELQIVPGHSVAEKMYFIHPCPKRLDLVLWRAHTHAAHSAFNYPGAAPIVPCAAMANLGPGDQLRARIAATPIECGPKP